MIHEAFLITALALAPASVQGNGNPHLSENGISFFGILNGHQRSLVVGGNPGYVLWLRQQGSNAFGALTDDWPGNTTYHAVCDAWKLSFQTNIFDSVWVRMRNPTGEPSLDWLADIARVIQPSGFLLFNDDDFPFWSGWLRSRNFERIPFRFKNYAIWRKPYYSDYHFKRGVKHARAVRSSA